MAGSSKVRAAVIHGDLIVDEHPDVVVATEGKFLALVVGERRMRLEAVLLVAKHRLAAIHVAPFFLQAPVPDRRRGTFMEFVRRTAVDTTRPASRIAVVVKDLDRIIKGNRRTSLSLGSRLLVRTQLLAIHDNNLGIGRRTVGDHAIGIGIFGPFQRIEASREAILRQSISSKVVVRRVGIEPPAGILAVMAERHVVALHFVLAGNIIEHRLEIRLGLGSVIAEAHLGIGRTGILRLAVCTEVFLDQSREYTHALARARYVSIRSESRIQLLVGIVDDSGKRKRARSLDIGIYRVPALAALVGPGGIVGNKEEIIHVIGIVDHRKVNRIGDTVIVPQAINTEARVRIVFQIEDRIGRGRVKDEIMPSAVIRRRNHGGILPYTVLGKRNHQLVGLPFLLFGKQHEEELCVGRRSADIGIARIEHVLRHVDHPIVRSRAREGRHVSAGVGIVGILVHPYGIRHDKSLRARGFGVRNAELVCVVRSANRRQVHLEITLSIPLGNRHCTRGIVLARKYRLYPIARGLEVGRTQATGKRHLGSEYKHDHPQHISYQGALLFFHHILIHWI